MAIRPILSALARNKLGPMLVAAQIAVTLAILINGSFIAKTRWDTISRPTGMDVENIFGLISTGFGKTYDELAVNRRDIETINQTPGVIAATTINSMPLSGGGWGEGVSAEPGEDAPDTSTGLFMIDENGIEALGVNLIAGRNFNSNELHHRDFRSGDMPNVTVITQELADELYPDENALNKPLYLNGQQELQIVGLLDHMHGAWVGWSGVGKVMLVPGSRLDGSQWYLIRTEPGQRDRLMAELEASLAATGDERVIRAVRSMSELRERSYSGDSAIAWALIVVNALLIVITALGIVGLASFLVAQRTKQIGTRRALGATKGDVVRYFLVENWLITTLGVSVGLILAVLLNYWMVKSFEMPKLNLVYLPIALAFVWALGLASALGPARRASRVPPAVATRTV